MTTAEHSWQPKGLSCGVDHQRAQDGRSVKRQNTSKCSCCTTTSLFFHRCHHSEGLGGRVIAIKSSSPITASTPVPIDKTAFFGSGARRSLHRALNPAVVKLICVTRLPPSLVDPDEWKNYSPFKHPAILQRHAWSLWKIKSCRSRNMCVIVNWPFWRQRTDLASHSTVDPFGVAKRCTQSMQQFRRKGVLCFLKDRSVQTCLIQENGLQN